MLPGPISVGLVITPPVVAGVAIVAVAVVIGDLGGGGILEFMGLTILVLGCGSGSGLTGEMVRLLKGNGRNAGRLLFAFPVIVVAVPKDTVTSLTLIVSPRSLL